MSESFMNATASGSNRGAVLFMHDCRKLSCPMRAVHRKESVVDLPRDLGRSASPFGLISDYRYLAIRKDRRLRASHERISSSSSSSKPKPVAPVAILCNKKITKETNGVKEALSTRKLQGVSQLPCAAGSEVDGLLANSSVTSTDESIEMRGVLRPSLCFKRAIAAALLVGGAVAAAAGRTAEPSLSTAGDTTKTHAGATTSRQAGKLPQPQRPYSKLTHHRRPLISDERNASASPAKSPEAQPSQRKLKLPRVQLRLRAVGWPDSDTRGDAAMLGSIASVALDLSLVEGTDGRVFDDDGRRDRYSHEYWFLADFDGGAVRLWQEPPGLHQRQPLVPLGVCPGEHAVSGWGVVVPSPGDSRAGAGEDVGGHPFVISAAPTTFVTHSSRMVIGSANRRVLPITAGVEGSSNAGGGFWGRGDGTASGDKEKCDGSERQPALPGREDQLQSRNGGGGGGGGLCRVCAHTLEEEEGRYDGEGFQFSLTSSVFPRRRRRLMLRTSLIASFAGSGNGTGHAAADGGGQDEHGQESAQEEREIEWAIELREGDSPAAAAREFVSERLGLAVRPKGTAPEVVRGPGAASSADAGGAGEGTAHVGQQAFGGEVAATGERMVRWVTKQLETELAERQVRRSLKRTEAAETASRTSQLRVVLGATVGAATDSGIDLYHPPQVGWLETDVNTLDVTDPSDFTFMLGAEGLVDAFVAEHVWEHLSLPDAHSATRNCERHLRPGGRLRIAVPNPAWYSASASEEGKSRRDVTPGPNKVEMASRTAIPTGLGLPDWLSQEMLMADARDRHLVQFTPELLANVCWSAGLTPFLLEGGGGAAEKVAATGEKGAVGPAAKAARKGGGKDAEVNCTAGNDNEREERSGPRRPKGSASLARFPAAGEDDVKERQRDHLWGHIRRSAAGGDPRGAVSIVMDCVKPTAENINAKHPESLKAGHGVADEQPTRHDAASQQSNFNMSEGLTPPESEPSSPSLYAVPSQRPSSIFDHSLVHPDTSQTVVEANRGFFTGMVAGITSGISHGRGGNDSASRGVVALGKASEAEGPTGEDTDVCSNDRSTGIVVRPVASRPRVNSNRAVGQGHASGGVGTGLATPVGSCRGLLCDGCGQSYDTVGSGEGGFGRPSPPCRAVSDHKNRGPSHAGEPSTGQPDEFAGGKGKGENTRRSGTQNQPRSAFPSPPSPSSSSPPRNEEATKLHISDEKTKSSGVVRTSVCDGQLSAPARWGRGFSLEAGLSVDDTTRKTNVSRGSRLSVLRHGGQDASSNRSPSGLYDDAGGDSPSQAGSIDPGGEVSTAEAHRVGEVHVAAALVRAGDEQQTTGGRGSREATVSRSVPVPLRVDNGTFVPGERPGLRSSPADPEPYEELDENGDDEVHASGVGNKSAQSHYNGESLEEWANAARKTGRVDLPVPKPAEPSSREQQMPSHNNSSSSIDDSEKDGLVFLTLQDLKSARSRAKKALLASNVTGTLEMCQTILRKWPSDGATLLYQGAAMAQGGEWDNAWDRMERVLALSSGVEKINLGPASAAAGYSTTHAGDGQGNTHSSAQQVDADGQSRAAAAAAEVPLDIALAAAANLASFARARAPKTLDQNAETFFLVEGLRGPADQDHRVGQERGKARAKSALPRSSRTSSPAERSKDENGSGNPEEPYKAGRIDGYTDLLIMMAQAFEGKGQLTSALRIYQRAILLGGHRDPRALHGIGGLSRRLLEVERERTRREHVAHSAGAPMQSSVPPGPLLPVPSPPCLDGHHLFQHRTDTGETATSSNDSEIGVAASRKQRHQQRPSGCEWGISHPKPGQVFSSDALVQVEFDLTLLDPGLPSAGSLFETIKVGNSAVESGGFSSEDSAQESKGAGIAVAEDGLGFIVCSYLEGYKAAHCLPRGQLRDVGVGWHVLTAEVYQLPSLRPFSCPAEGHTDSTKTVRFCVGEATTTCKKPLPAAGGGGGEYNNRSGDLTDAEEPGRISKHEDRETMSSSCEGVDLAGGPETPEKDSAKERLFQGGKVKNARTEAPSAEAGDELQAEVALPFCFMTLALNAMPFITHHAPVFDEVGQILSKRAAATAGPSGSSGPSKTAENARGSSNSSFYPEKPPAPPPPEPVSFWEWHVVEGVAAGRANHGNPYSRRRIPDRYFDAGTGLSVDGTTQYLDGLVESGAGANALSSPRPRKVYVHRRCGEPPRSSGPYAEAHKPRVDGVGDDHKWFGGGDSSSDKTRARSTSCLWRDKIQMVNSVAFSLEHECLLVQIDADELWTAEQLVRLRDMFLLERNGHRADDGSTTGAAGGREEQRPAPGHLTEATGSIADREDRQQQHSHNRTSRECAYFDCHFFVGPDLVTVTEDGWGHSAGNEWLRAWVFRPRQSLWLQHAPPQLARHDEAAGWKMLAGDQCISRAETRERGLGFTHYAYVFEEQVRFKDEFYGHSEMVKTADAVAEWVALQEATPPVPLADHLTWLRIQGEAQDPRLLATVADRAPTSNSCRTRLPPISATGTGYPGGGGVGEGNQRGGDAPGTTGTGISLAERDVTAPGQGGCESFPLVPLEPFLQLAKRGSSDNTAAGLWRRAGRYTQAAENKREGLRLTHNANTHLKEHRSRDHRLPRSRSGSRDQQARTGRTASMEQVSAAPDGCGLLHLVVDGAVFQVEAVRPSGITRVWENALPAMLGRLSGFEGTCLTLLVRGQAPPPVAIEAAFSRLPSERFAVAHVPPYNPSFGFVADRIMLSWVVRSAGATAFVSTLHTHPYWATTPNVVRLLLVHDLLPELFGWDMTSGEWLEKLNAVAVASSVVAVSQHTAKDFLRVYPSPHAGNGADTATGRDRPPAAAATTARPVWAAHNGVDTTVFHPRAPSDEKLGRYDGGNSNSNGGQHDSNRANVDSEAFRRAAGLEPGTQYVLIVGSRHGYKNARTVYHAFGRAATSTVAADRLAASVAPALVLVGGGPVTPEELEVLSEVGVWSHIGAGSGIPTGAAPSKPPAGPGTAVVDDRLLAAGYAGAVALLHLSLAEGFGLTVLEAFACGCPVIATDIPPVREIAGLPDLENARAAVAEEDRGSAAAASNGNTIARNSRPPRDGDGSFGVAPTRGKRADRYQGASASLEGGLVLVENPASATQVWRAVRAVVAMGPERRAAVSEALVRRAKVFDSWQPLADTLIKAAVE